MEENEVMTTEVEESVEQEVAEPETNDNEVETTEEESVETQEVAEPETQSKEQNAIYANMRRKAEAEAKREADRRIAQLCKDVVHPITGKPITTFDEYEDAINAQNRLQAQHTLEENGLDISILDEYVNSSPVLAKANAIIEQNQQAQADAMLKADFEAIQALNSDIKTFADLQNDPKFDEMLRKVQQGASLVDAYKIVNFDLLMNKEAKGAKQAAINQARGKSHLEPTEGVNEPTGDLEIPNELIGMLKDTFPDKSMKEIKKLYNQVYKDK